MNPCGCNDCPDCVPSPKGWDAFAASTGFTGEKTDALGRRICYDNGKRVACPKQAAPTKPASKAAPAKAPPAKAAPKPAAPPKPTVEGMAAALKSIKAAGPVSAAKTKEVAAKLAQMTVKELGELKGLLGIKASGTKAALAGKIAERALAAAKVAKAAPKAKPAATDTGQSPAKFAYPAGFTSKWDAADDPEPPAPNPAAPDVSRPKLTASEANSIAAYAGKHYSKLNHELRGGEPLTPELAAVHADLQAAFARAAPFPKPVKVIRGLDLLPKEEAAFRALVQGNLDAGKSIRFPGYSSTSTGESFLQNVGGNVRVEIEATHGLDVKPYAAFPSEDEILLDHNSEFEVQAVEDGPSGLVVRLRQRPPVSKASEVAATFTEALEMFADATPDGETGDRRSRFVDDSWDWIDFDPQTTDAVSEHIDPADPEAAEKARLMAELLLGDETGTSAENPSA